MAKCIFSGIHNYSDYTFEFDLGGNKDRIRLNCRYNVLTGNAVKDDHFIAQCPPEVYKSIPPDPDPYKDRNKYDQEHFPMQGPVSYDNLYPVFIGPYAGSPPRPNMVPTPLETLPYFVVLPGGYCRMDRDMPVELSQVKIYAYQAYTGRGSRQQQNQLEISLVENTPILRFKIFRGGQLVLTRDVSMYRSSRYQQLSELYITISPEEGFFVQPMDDKDLGLVQACRKEALYLWEVFTGTRERIVLKLGDNAAFSLFSDNERIALPDVDFPDATDKKPLETAGFSYSFQTLTAPAHFPEKDSMPYVAFKLKLVSEEKIFAEPGKSRQMRLAMDDLFTVINPANGQDRIIEWGLVQPAGAQHSINAQGLFTAGKTAAGAKALPCKITATITIQLEMTWPDAWPKLGQGRHDQGWLEDAAGQKAVWLLYNVLKAMPEQVTTLLKETTFVRRRLEQSIAEYIAMTDVAVIPDATILQGDPVKLAYQFVRMMARAALAGKCGVNFKNNFAQIAIVWQKYQEAEVAQWQWLPSLFTMVEGYIPVKLVTDTLFSWAIDLVMRSNGHTRDACSDYASETGWSMHNYSPLVTFPGIGWIAGILFSRQPPSYPYVAVSSIGNFYEVLGIYNHEMNNADWKAAGMPNAMALTGPEFDFAESFTSYAFTADVPVYCGVDSKQINDKRKKLISKNYFPGNWQPLTPDRIRSFARLQTGIATGTDKKIKAASAETAVAPAFHIQLNQRSRDYATDAGQRLLEDVYYSMKRSLYDWKDKYKNLFDNYRKTIRDLEIPLPPNPGPMDFVRSLAIHGDGLIPYKPGDAVRPGDVLISYEQHEEQPVRSWLVLSVTKDNAITEIAGILRSGFNGPERALRVATSAIKYSWRPVSRARSWDRQAPATAYPQLNKSLHDMILLWGMTENKVTNDDYSRIEGFFKAWLRISALKDVDYKFEFGYSYADIWNYLYTHGQGLQRYRSQVKLSPGDIVIPYHQNTLGIVTRTDENGVPLDVLYGGTWGGGVLGEPAGSVMHMHRIDAEDLRYYWQPDAKPKTWIK